MALNFDIKHPEDIPIKRIIAIISITSTFLNFAPDGLLNKLCLLDFRNYVAPYLGIIFVVCCAFWVTQIFLYIRKKTAFNERNAKKRFEIISETALTTILKMYKSPTHSTLLNIDDATTLCLENFLFIHRGSVSSHGFEFDYLLQPWVVRYLNKHYYEYKKLISEQEV